MSFDFGMNSRSIGKFGKFDFEIFLLFDVAEPEQGLVAFKFITFCFIVTAQTLNNEILITSREGEVLLETLTEAELIEFVQDLDSELFL